MVFLQMTTLNMTSEVFKSEYRIEEFYSSFWVPTLFMVVYSGFFLFLLLKLFQALFSNDLKKYELVKIYVLLILQTVGTIIFLLKMVYFISGDLGSKSHRFYTLVFLISGFVCVLLMVTSKGFRIGKIEYPESYTVPSLERSSRNWTRVWLTEGWKKSNTQIFRRQWYIQNHEKVRIGENFYKIADEHDLLKLCSMVTGVTRVHPRDYSDKRMDLMSNKNSEVRLKIHEELPEKQGKKANAQQGEDNPPMLPMMPMTKAKVLKKESLPKTSGDEDKALPVRLSDKLKNKFFSRKVPVEEHQVALEPERTLVEKTTSNKMIPLQAKNSLEALNSNKSIERDKADGLCSVCCDSPACIINIPCGHGGTCFQCASELIFTNGLCYLCKMVKVLVR